MSRAAIVAAVFAACALVAEPVWREGGPSFIWNPSASLPIGLYQLAPVGRLAVADLVVVTPPEPLANFLVERGYLPHGVPLIKRVLALPGTTVCRNGRTIVAYDFAYGEAREADSGGRPLPSWQGCRTLIEGQMFLMNWDAADSFDSRYFGPLPVTSIIARAVPLWTDANGDGRSQWHAGDPPDVP